MAERLQPRSQLDAAGTVVQFFVRAADGLDAMAAYPPDGPDSGALYVVNDGQFDARRGHNLRLLLTPANRDLLHAFTNVMSNDELPATVIYDERRAYYDVGLRLKGSQRGRYSDTRVSFHLEFQPDDLFRDVHPVMLIDRSGAGDSTGNKQLEILIKHLVTRVGGIAGPPADPVKSSPRAAPIRVRRFSLPATRTSSSTPPTRMGATGRFSSWNSSTTPRAQTPRATRILSLTMFWVSISRTSARTRSSIATTS